MICVIKMYLNGLENEFCKYKLVKILRFSIIFSLKLKDGVIFT